MRLTTLKPRIATLDTRRVRTLDVTPGATPRQRGRGWLTRRAQWLSLHPLCAHCERSGRVTLAAEVDHVVPLHKGGADDDSNFQSLCVECHKVKTAADAGRVRRVIGLDGYPIE